MDAKERLEALLPPDLFEYAMRPGLISSAIGYVLLREIEAASTDKLRADVERHRRLVEDGRSHPPGELEQCRISLILGEAELKRREGGGDE
jgi:hypothetical protein